MHTEFCNFHFVPICYVGLHFEEVIAMKKAASKPNEVWTEIKCPACNGTGFPTNIRSIQPGRKIYPAQCKECFGKGRIRKVVR